MKKLFLAVAMLGGVALGANHPGNVFVKGEEVRVKVPAGWAGWHVVDVDGKEVGKGTGAEADLGKLSVGYYEVKQQGGSERVTAGVIEPVKVLERTPIALDAAMSWLYPEASQVRDACALCKLAGVAWVRDRGSWPEMETARGVWAGEGRSERTMRMEHEEGMKILQVNHISPAWAEKDARHFPDDLRDVYEFYRGLNQRWHGLIDAIEPWNEPDIVEFGGHTGCEIASFQKAAYLGLKAGDPKMEVNEAVFAIDRPETLEEFGWNEVWPYFDRYDLHHYKALTKYPELYARQRAQSGGRPMWTTEFNLTVHWEDPKTHEPTDEQLRVQAYRVSKVFSEALFQGTQKAFYFILGDHAERNVQYGLLHADMTPRPAYVAFAAVGRLLNGAERIGRVDLGDEKLQGYVFKTMVDGAEKETLVAWSETKKGEMEVRDGEVAYDYLGRELAGVKKVELTREPVFVVLPVGGEKRWKIEEPPAKAEWREGKTCPVVLQLIGTGDVNQSGFVLDEKKAIRLVAYNFGDKDVKGKIVVEGASGGDGDIEVKVGAREERVIALNGPGEVKIRGEFGESGQALVAARVVVVKPAEEGKK